MLFSASPPSLTYLDHTDFGRLSVYGSYLVFQLFSHKNLYADKHEDNFVSTRYTPRKNKEKKIKEKQANGNGTNGVANGEFGGELVSSPRSSFSHNPDTVPNGHPDVETPPSEHSDDEEETPQMSVPLTVALLVIVTVVRLDCFPILLGLVCQYETHICRVLQLVAVTAEFLVDSIDGLTESGHISKEFVGIILLPIVGNAAGAPPLDSVHPELN